MKAQELKRLLMLAYQIKLTDGDNGTLLVTCPKLPEVTTFGTSRLDAFGHAVDAIEEALAARISRGQEIPTSAGPGARDMVRLPLLTAMKVMLYIRTHEAGVTRAELARRLNWHREQVDRLFRLDHASRIDQIEAAFRALGADIDAVVGRSAFEAT
jgi:antitoxin HicB